MDFQNMMEISLDSKVEDARFALTVTRQDVVSQSTRRKPSSILAHFMMYLTHYASEFLR